MRRLVVVLVSLVLLAGGVAWFRHSSPDLRFRSVAKPAVAAEAALDGGVLASVATRSAPAGADPAPATAQRFAGVPLPAADAPLNQTFGDLLTRAQAGDTRAACRLGADLLRCRNARALADVFAKYSLPVDAGLPADATARLQRALDAVDRCKDVPREVIAQGPRWLRRAADSGSRDAMVMYATGAGFGSGPEIFAMLHSPDFDDWRQRAPDLLRQALRLGSADAALALAQGAQGDDTPVAALIPNDPVQGNAYQLLWLRLHPGSKGRMAVLTPAQDAQVSALVETMFRDDFGGVAPSAPVATLRATDFDADSVEGLCDDVAH